MSFFIYCTCLLAFVTIFLRNKILAAPRRQTHVPFPRASHGADKCNSALMRDSPFLIVQLRGRNVWVRLQKRSSFLRMCFSFLTSLPHFFQWPIALFRRQLSWKWKNWRVKRGWNKGRSGRSRGRFLCLEDGPPYAPFTLIFISFTAKEHGVWHSSVYD
jgi:hypothetical protein